ncbi:hypothetical protein GJ496_002736, partial [Pomphorhynchus laevis]
NEALRLEFAKRANFISNWIDNINEQISVGIVNTSLEEQLDLFKSLQHKVVSFQHNMDDLESCNHNLQKAMIFENLHTVYSMDTLRMNYRQLVSTINEQIGELESQIMLRDSKGISEDQLGDFRASFNHFDKDKSGHLELKEFRSCLMALGYIISDNKQGDKEFQQIAKLVDPMNTGLVSFDAFLDFMTREVTEENSIDQLMQSFRILSSGESYITKDQLRNELPQDQAEYCIERMKQFSDSGAPPNALDYIDFITTVYGQTDVN